MLSAILDRKTIFYRDSAVLITKLSDLIICLPIDIVKIFLQLALRSGRERLFIECEVGTRYRCQPSGFKGQITRCYPNFASLENILVEDFLVSHAVEKLLGRNCSAYFWVFGKHRRQRLRRVAPKYSINIA